MDKPLSSSADGWLIVMIACQDDREKKNRNRQQKKAVRRYGGKEMKEHFVTEEAITAFVQYLRQEEREAATIEKYRSGGCREGRSRRKLFWNGKGICKRRGMRPVR